MVKHIALFAPPKGQYGVLHHFTKELTEALKRNDIDCSMLTADYHNPKPFLEQLFAKRPDCTLSFNGLLPDNEGRFFCDMVEIPHLACLTDAPNRFLPLINSPYTLISCPDRFGCDFFKGLNFNRVFFLPHATSQEAKADVKQKRDIDLLFLGSCLDYASIEKEWKKNQPEPVYRALLEAAEVTLAEVNVHYVQAFVNALDSKMRRFPHLDVERLNYPQLFEDLEVYIRGKERIKLLQSIKTIPIELYTQEEDISLWKNYLKGQKNIIYNNAVPFETSIELMKRAKIVLNTSPTIKNGGHERIFSAMAAGAVVFTGANIFLEEQFQDRKQLYFFTYDNLEQFEDDIKTILEDEPQRQAIAQSAQQAVLTKHTWDQRAKLLIKELTPLLEKMDAKAK